MYVVDERQVGAFTCKVVYDEDGSGCDPRDWDHGTLMSLTASRWSFPNDAGVAWDDHNSWDEVLAWLEATYDLAGIKPVYMIDHSGIGLRTSDYGDPWDSGQVGFVMMTREGQTMGGTPDDRVGDLLDGIVAEYGAWCNGEVYGWIVEDADGDELESCWGYVGDDEYAMTEAVSTAEHLEGKRWEAWAGLPEWVQQSVLIAEEAAV